MRTNEELQKMVMAEIKWDPQLKEINTQIGVSVKDGVVTLSGVVDSYTKKLAAERATQRVHGVKVVASDIEVKIGTFYKKTDTEIAEAVKNALKWNTAVQEDKIEVKVDNGWVYLDGEVEWEYQKSTAEKSISDLLSVRGVTNNIRIKSKAIDVKDIKTKITSAFHRNATLDSAGIRVEATGNKIILRGNVRSWAEKQEAERVAWSSPGVFMVDNELEIGSEIYA